MTGSRATPAGPTWAAVFEGLDWPLALWQLLVAADEYGVSPQVTARLARVPEHPYRDLAELEAALALAETGPRPTGGR